MAGAQPQARAASSKTLIVSCVLACGACRTTIVHYEWSADRRHRVRVLERGIDQFVERDGIDEAAYRAIGVEHMVLSEDGRHLAYPAMSADGWEVVFDGRSGGSWRGIGEIALGGDHLAYAALDETGWRVVRDGTLGPVVDAIMSGTMVWSPDGARLVYVGARGKASFVFDGERTFGGFDLVGRPIFSADSRRLAFAASRGSRVRAVVDGVEQESFEEIVELAFSSDGARLGYFGLRGDRWYAVVDGAVGPGAELLASLRFSAGGRVAYVAKDDRWHAIAGGERIASHDEIDHRSVCFAGEELAFAARDGESWTVGGGPKLDAIEALICGPRIAYVGRIGDRAVVIDGGREVGRFIEADAPIYSRDGKLAFIGIDDGGAFVRIDSRRIAVRSPVFGTLVISDDGSHFALVESDPETRDLWLAVDGERRERFDFEEPAALFLKDGRRIVLRQWVAAELASLRQAHR
jgi:hypothetical protein